MMKKIKGRTRSCFLAGLILPGLAGLSMVGCSQNGPAADVKKITLAQGQLRQGEYLQAQQTLSQISSHTEGQILSLLALFTPQAVLDDLRARGNLDLDEAQIAVQCLRIQNRSQAEIEKQEKQWIYPVSKFEQLAEATAAPSVKDPLQQFREEVKVFVTTAQKLRLQLDSEVARKPLEVQLRVLESDRALETRVGEFLKHVPNAPGMSGKRLIDYKKGFVKISEGYFSQASKIAQREADIRKNLTETEALDSCPNWPWPRGVSTGEGGFAPLKKALDEKNDLAALILSDFLRHDLLKQDSDYYSVRAGVILEHASHCSNDSSGPSPEGLKRFAFWELAQAKQTELILQWKKCISGG